MATKTALFQFTQKELDSYIKDDNSCVKCVPSQMHIGFPPHGLDNFKETLLNIISKKKIGQFDEETKGIVLDVRKIKLEGTMSMIRQDSPELHLNIHAIFYVFQPHVGALLKGTVKYISKRHISALIYNVFNVSIRLNGDFKRKLQVNKEISFRVKKFDLENVLPYIEGELITAEDNADSGIDGDKTLAEGKSVNKKISFADSSSDDDDSENEKMFKSLVVKTEATKSTKGLVEDSSSSDSDDDSSSEEGTVVKKEPVKKEANKCNSSSSEESSDEDLPSRKKTIAVPPVVAVKTDKDATSSNSSSSENDGPANQIPPNQLISLVQTALKKEAQSDSDTSSDEEDFKVPMPVVKIECGQIVVKREITPSRRIRNDSSSSLSDFEGMTSAGAKRSGFQSPAVKNESSQSVKKSKNNDTVIHKSSTIKRTNSKNEDLEARIEDIVAKVTQRHSDGDASELEEQKKVDKKISPTKKVEKLIAPVVVKQEPSVSPVGKKSDGNRAVKATKDKSSTKNKITNSKIDGQTSKINDIVGKGAQSYSAEDNSQQEIANKKGKLPSLVEADSSSSSDESDEDGRSQFNSTIQNLLSQVVSSKTNINAKAAPAKKRDVSEKPFRKRKSSTGGEADKSTTVAAATIKRKPKKDGDLMKYFAADALSSTRLDANASPIPKPKKKKGKE